jgi:hypothetical protein
MKYVALELGMPSRNYESDDEEKTSVPIHAVRSPRLYSY